MAELDPQLVRVFFSGTAFTDPDLMQSFRRTLKLAQTAASSINVTFQGIGPAFPDAMPAFAECSAVRARRTASTASAG